MTSPEFYKCREWATTRGDSLITYWLCDDCGVSAVIESHPLTKEKIWTGFQP